MFNAKWLRYLEFSKHGFRYVEFESFAELVSLICFELNQTMETDVNSELV